MQSQSTSQLQSQNTSRIRAANLLLCLHRQVRHHVVHLHGGGPEGLGGAIRAQRALAGGGEEGIVRAEHDFVLSRKLNNAVHRGFAVSNGIEIHPLEVVSGGMLQSVGHCNVVSDTTVEPADQRRHRGTSMSHQQLQIRKPVQGATDNQSGHRHSRLERKPY
jgi:hypothetical protein